MSNNDASVTARLKEVQEKLSNLTNIKRDADVEDSENGHSENAMLIEDSHPSQAENGIANGEGVR